MRFLVSTRGENDVSRSDLALGRSGQKWPPARRLQAGHRDAVTDRRTESLGVPDQVADNFVPGHEPVGIISAVAPARQLDRPVGNDQAEAVPATAPCLANSSPLENDVVNAGGDELVAERKPRLAGPDDDDVDSRVHRREATLTAASPTGPGPQKEEGLTADTRLDPANIPRAPAGQYTGGVTHLGNQHDLSARCGNLQPRGVPGQRFLHRQDGAVRGSPGRWRRYRRAPRLVSAWDGDAGGFDAPLRAVVADPRPVLAVGSRLRSDRSGVHVLLRRRGGVAGRCAQGDRLHRRAGSGIRAGPGGNRSGDAQRLGRWRVDRPADQSWSTLRAPRPDSRRDVRSGVQADARCRVLSREGWAGADRDPKDRLRLDRVWLAGARGQVADDRIPVHGRRGDLRFLRAAAVPASAVR